MTESSWVPSQERDSATSRSHSGAIYLGVDFPAAISGSFIWGNFAGTVHADLIQKLAGSLSWRGVDVDSKTLLEAMQEVVLEAADLSSEPLTEGERDYLIENGELTEAELSEEARDATRAGVAESRAAVTEAVSKDALSTADVTALTKRPGPSLRRSVSAGDLYVLNPGDSRGLKFPQWQFVGARVVPGLSRIIPALPEGMHPLLVESFMTRPRESLGDLSPVEWLTTDGAVDQVVRLADEERRR